MLLPGRLTGTSLGSMLVGAGMPGTVHQVGAECDVGAVCMARVVRTRCSAANGSEPALWMLDCGVKALAWTSRSVLMRIGLDAEADSDGCELAIHRESRLAALLGEC